MRRSLSLLMILLFLYQILSERLWAQTIIAAQVTDVLRSQIEIDRGLNSGLKIGSEGVVYYMQPVGNRSVRVAVALVRVLSVTSTTARLVIEDSTADVMEGYIVELSVKKGGSKWWIWLLIAAAGGGIAAAVGGGGGGGGGTPPTTGTITYDIPAD